MKRVGRNACQAEVVRAQEAREQRQQHRADELAVDDGGKGGDRKGTGESWWERRKWNWDRGYFPADGDKHGPLAKDGLMGADADLGRTHEVEKCAWDPTYGCGSFLARLSWETVAAACTAELAPALLESERLHEPLSVQVRRLYLCFLYCKRLPAAVRLMRCHMKHVDVRWEGETSIQFSSALPTGTH
jgi:hypothetical protein